MVGEAHGQPEKLAKNQIGVSFLALIFAIAIISISLTGVGTLWQLERKREKEKALLFAGEAYRQALASYFNSSPGNNPQYPQAVAELLLDPRFPNPVRHLRQPYPDPMSADGVWELIRRDGRIIGVASRSPEAPLKISGFAPQQASFEGATHYRDWQFIDDGINSSRRIASAGPDAPR